jgi:hypothetical protein
MFGNHLSHYVISYLRIYVLEAEDNCLMQFRYRQHYNINYKGNSFSLNIQNEVRCNTGCLRGYLMTSFKFNCQQQRFLSF